jgi:transcriptional regulator with XRE-family HTH domain
MECYYASMEVAGVNMPTATATGRTIGANVRAIREGLERTQEWLARRAGPSLSYVQKLEQGRVNAVNSDMLRSLAEALGVTVDRLMRES